MRVFRRFRPLIWMCCGLAFAAAQNLKVMGQSSGFTVPSANWVDWTSDTTGNPGGSAAGTVTIGSSPINVSYSGEVYTQTQTNGPGKDYYTPITTYSNAFVPNPPLSGMITFVGGNTTDTVTFSQVVTNPVMAIVSQGSPGVNVDFTFNHPFQILSTGPGSWGTGALLTQTSNTLHGAESDGIIQFTGAFTSISWTVSPGDTFYNGCTFGVPGPRAPQISGIEGGNALLFAGEPWSLTAWGQALLPVTNQWLFDGTNLTDQVRVFGSQSNTLTFSNVLVGDSGTYTFVVSNAYGWASSNVNLSVLPDSAYNTFNNYAMAVTNLPGLLGYWRFDPTFQMNSCVNGYTGTSHGSAQIGRSGSGCPLNLDANNQSLLLNGTTGYLSTSLTGQIGNQGTLLAWVYLTAEPSTAGHIFSVVDQSQNGNNFDLQIETDNKTKFYAGGAVAVYNEPLPINQWHFLAATLDSTGALNLYLDGQLVATATGGGHSVTANPVCIGESQVFTGRYFQGRIDEVAIYNVALTPSDVTTIYDLGVPPELNIKPKGGTVLLTWPTNYPDFSLQTNGVLDSPSGWSTCTTIYPVTGTNYTVTNEIGASPSFYRLER